MTKQQSMKSKNKSSKILIYGLTEAVDTKELINILSEIGPIRKYYFPQNNDGTFNSHVYVTYSQPDHATEAVKALNKKTMNGVPIFFKFRNQPDIDKEMKPKVKTKNKEERIYSLKKKGKIIIRNLSFSTNEEQVEKYFQKFGEIVSINILKKEDGKSKGCAFVHFRSATSAAKAIAECNLKLFHGRLLAVDMAIPKDKYQALCNSDTCTKKCEDLCSVTEEEEGKQNIQIKQEKGDSDISCDEVRDEECKEPLSDDEISLYNKEEKMKTEKNVNQRYSSLPSKDIVEGRTLFLRGLTFDITEEEVANVLKKYGELKYVIFCIDSLTETFKGSGFAQFLSRECADACLAAFESGDKRNVFSPLGHKIYISTALSRQELSHINQKKEKKKKDNRNLYLAREGIVRQGTQAALGVSNADLQLRAKRNAVKKKMLQNLHIFISTTRLCVSNLLAHINDKQLRDIFKKHSPKDAMITESRVMRNLKNIAEGGTSKSKGYAFVNFTEHAHALAALRAVNNNPNIFSYDKRPVVEFSLENRAALKAREKRLIKSKENNPLCKKDNNLKTEASCESSSQKTALFAGLKVDPKTNYKLQNLHTGPKLRKRQVGRGVQKISRNKLKKDKVKLKKLKNVGEKSNTKPLQMQESKITKNAKESKKRKSKNKKLNSREVHSEKAFISLVQNYKNKLKSVSQLNERNKKWYE